MFTQANNMGNVTNRRPPSPPVTGRDGMARERTILDHQGLVRSVASRMARRLPSHVDVDELVNIGVIGLIDAIDRYDDSRGVPFRAYAEIRIRGAMVDALRCSDWTPRGVRRTSGRLEAVRSQLRDALGREPRREEMARALEVTPEEYDRLRQHAEQRRFVSLDTPVGEDGEVSLADRLADDDAVAPLDAWLAVETQQGVGAALERLNERERYVVTAHYQKGLSFREIGQTLGVTESRTCQIHAQALRRLHRLLREDSE
jgi:RNA polymerase sigma factor for flagellar operon FliA